MTREMRSFANVSNKCTNINQVIFTFVSSENCILQLRDDGYEGNEIILWNMDSSHMHLYTMRLGISTAEPQKLGALDVTAN